MKQQSGFTLIELIMVIVILGILAATAMPKFSDLSGEARVAKLNAMKAAMQSAAAMAHGVYLARGLNASSDVTVEKGTIAISMVNGWPAAPTATASGILAAVDLSDYYSGAYDTSGVSADLAHVRCAVSYINAAALTATPSYVITSAPADCS